MTPTRVLALVLAGGNGTRLHPLTAEHAKPALPFAAGYRIVDFVLSSLVNSNISSIYVLAQYKPQSLMEHIRAAWAPWRDGEHFIKVVLPETNGEAGSFKGTSDAVYQNLHLIERHRPDLVAVFAADHVYRRAYASMGNYLFNPRVLVALLEEASRHGDTDFGRHIMPRLLGKHCAFAYDFSSNTVPGIQPYEERGYWRDVGTLEAYQAAQSDLLDPRPRFRLENPQWPIGGSGYRVRTATPNSPRFGCPKANGK